MSVVRERLVRALVTTLVLSHELGHAALTWVCRLDPEVTVLPSWRGETVPLARFNADLDPGTPVVLIRAVAPLALALLAAGLVGTGVPRGSPLVVALLAVRSFRGSLSGGDLATLVLTPPTVSSLDCCCWPATAVSPSPRGPPTGATTTARRLPGYAPVADVTRCT